MEQVERTLQRYLDLAVPHTLLRWLAFSGSLIMFALRIVTYRGFYIIAYGLGIYLLHLFIAFISPPDDLDNDGPMLPTDEKDEFKPFQRRLPEYKFWFKATKAVVTSLFFTIFPFLDIPVFWPILVMYFLMLVFLTLKKQIKHMIKHRYVPFSFGKKRYATR